MRHKLLRNFLVITVFSFTLSSVHAQEGNTMFFMKGIPHNYQLNPAFQSDCNFFLGFPGLAPLQLKAENSSFGLSDVFQYESSIDSLITFLHPLGDKEAFLDLLDDRNYINTEFSTSLASFGFRMNQTFFTFDIRERMQARASYPRDLVRFPLYGPDEGMSYDFSGLGLNLNVFNEFSLGISHKITEQLTVGWRGKLLFGQANLMTEDFNFNLTTGEELWSVRSDFQLNATLPFADIVYDEEGMIDLENSDVRDDLDNNIPSLIVNPYNFGLAMDLGVDFRLNDWVELSASVIDLGSIKWKDYVYNITNEAEYDFEGIEIKIDDEDFMENFADSLEDSFNNLSATETQYTTWLPTKIYAGAAFYPHPRIGLGVLSRTDIVQGDLRQQFTLSANFYPLRMLSAAFSYTIMEDYYKNIGIGLGLKAGPFNLYLMTDTGPSAVFWPVEARYMNFKIGMNLVFGCQKPGGRTIEKPLID